VLLCRGQRRAKARVETQKDRLFDDDVEALLDEMARRLDLIPKTGLGTKGRRDRLRKARNYIARRASKLHYGWLRRRDLVSSTGIVEGAVKNLIGRRCDHGGMRWIRERAQAVLQLRCIEADRDWTGCEQFVHDRLRADARLKCAPERLQTAIAQQLPEAA